MHTLNDMKRHDTRRSRAFTLTEMLVAVAVLAVVILATSTIFGTSQRVASLGEANAELIQQASVIERRIRRDIERMSTDGFLAIQCVGVQNDLHFDATGRMLNPSPIADREVRCDQLVFFTNGREPSTRFAESYNASGQGSFAPAEATASRIYIGHGVQMPVQPPRSTIENAILYDHDRDQESIYPWTFNATYPVLPSGSDVPLITPPAHDWVLVRQPILLADDNLLGVIASGTGGYNSVQWSDQYMGFDLQLPNSAPTLFYQDGTSLRFDPEITNGRVDVAASELDDVRREVCVPWNDLGPADSTDEQVSPLVRSDGVLEAMFEGYPRGERVAPSMKNLDQMLVNNVLAGSVSDFRIEWTWSDGVGRDRNAKFFNTNEMENLQHPSHPYPAGLPGVIVNDSKQPWFGLPNGDLGTWPVSNYQGDSDFVIGEPVGPAMSLIERFPNAPSGVRRYGAVFGYNRDRGIMRAGDDNPIADVNNQGIQHPIWGDPYGYAFSGNTNYNPQTYTPWPTALRITMRLHDSRNTIEGGRVFQFVVPIPRNE